jgi:hypothetical protein
LLIARKIKKKRVLAADDGKGKSGARGGKTH